MAVTNGGTHSVSFHQAVKQEKTVSVDKFRDLDPYRKPAGYEYHPGQVTDEKGHVEIFNTQMDRGSYSKINGALNWMMRRFLKNKDKRTASARIAAAFISAAIPGNRLDMYSISSHIGGFKAFDGINPWGKEIVHAVVEGGYFKQGFRLAGTFIFWQFNWTPPEFILHQKRDTVFHDISGEIFQWVDGDTKINPLRGEVEIKRAEMPIYLAGLAG